MRHINLFSTVGMAAIIAVLMSFTFVSCQKEKDDTPDPEVLEGIFHFTARESNLEVSMILESDTLEMPPLPSLLYSLDGKNWEEFIPAVTTVKAEKAGDKVYFKANSRNSTFSDYKITIYEYDYSSWYTNGYCFTISAKADVGGDIMYLLDGENPASATMGDAAFACLFRYSEDKIIDASELILPAAKLTPFCFFQMFGHCSNLVAAPELPATELAKHCYDEMFFKCSSLEKAPELPATQLADYCYYGMFCDCTSLKHAPELPAKKLAIGCYEAMFLGSAIETAPELPATQLARKCYTCMFQECSSLVNPPALPATELEDDCYVGMFVGCISLVEAPALPAKELKEGCYYYMFTGCTSLKSAPELPATQLVDECYCYMFFGCSGLEKAPELPATQLADYCYLEMFDGCTSIVEAPSLPARELKEGCYYKMFGGCSSLIKATVMAEDLSPEDCVYEMFEGITTSGTLTAAPGVDWTGVVPATWTVEETVPIYTEGSYSGEGIKIGDTWWAPVNCGYDTSHPYGLLYQWGRKYGQAYELGTITPETLSKEDGQKETNKDKFGECDSTTYNWFTGTVDNTLWSGSSKGTYDPCPAGWRVPTESEFTSLTSTKSWITNGGPSSDQNGYLFGTSPNQVFLPAAGYRYHDDGNTYSRGKYGVYWSSSPDSTDSICVRYLDFWASTANMCRGCERAYGYPVRCVQE